MGLSASSTSWRSPGAILDAQPAQAAYEVSRTSVWVCLAIAALRRVRRGLRFDELDEGLGERRAAPVAVGDQIERAPDAQILHPETEEEPRTALVLHRPLRDERDSDACAHRSEEHTSELQSLAYLVCRLLLEKKKTHI